MRVDVEDRGIGIPEESLPQLFTPFFRARNATEHYAGGLGLGLAICRESRGAARRPHWCEE